MRVGDVVGVDARAVRRADPRRVDQVLDEQRAPGERPAGAAQRLVEPGDPGVVGVARGAHGTSATHSTSIFAPGITSAEISTSVEAGRVSPKTSWRTGFTSGRSSTSVRKTVTLTTSANVQPPAARTCAHVLEHAARLRDDVVSADELAPLVDGDDAGDEQEVARLDGVREVRDRLGLAGDPELAAVRQAATRARDDAQRVRCIERGLDRLALARSPTMTFTWKSRSRSVSRPTAPRPAKHSNVPRRSFIAESGRRLEPTESRQPITTTTHRRSGRGTRRPGSRSRRP